VDGVDALPCRGGLAGALYEALDRGAAVEVDVSYLLREHETTGGVRDYGPLRLPAGAREATWNPETGRSASRGAWSPVRPGRAEPGDGGGCATAAGGGGDAGASMAAVLLGAGAVLLRRRRSRARR
jgi:MYXO-CTERM domain-containing protein